MFIDVVPNRTSPPAILLRESYREGGKVKKRTLTNLSTWPAAQIEALRAVLRGATAVGDLEQAFEILRSLPHGHVAAVLGMWQKLGLAALLEPRRSRTRDLCTAMICARLVAPGSKLALARQLHPETATHTLGEELGLGAVDTDELYAAMDWLLTRQRRVEDALARRHLVRGTLVLYDVTSTYFEGRTCPLGALGYSRDGHGDKLQIVFGLLTNGEGCPVAVEVFEGNTADPMTVASQVKKLKTRFGLDQVILVGDRGMLTRARIEQDLQTAGGIEWITSLRAPAIRQLVDGGVVQLSFFDERDLCEVTSPDYPGERLVVCRNPLLAVERKRKREDLLVATEKELEKIRAATLRGRAPLRGQDAIGVRVGRVLGRFKMGKHFRYEISDSRFTYERDQDSVAREALLDGLYVLRTNVTAARMDDEEVVHSYKRLCQIERAFRSLKTVDLHVRPINHRLAGRVRAHVFLCMVAYYVEWHMREALAPILFDDHDRSAAQAARPSVVAPPRPSPAAQRKAFTKRTDDDLPVTSFHDLIDMLGTIVRNTVRPTNTTLPSFSKITTPSALQQRAFDLLGVRL
jgi:transposase